MKTVLRYAGGKSRAINKISPFVDPYDTIVSPFIGGGSLEVYWASQGKKVIGSDVFDLLVNYIYIHLEFLVCLILNKRHSNHLPLRVC